MKKVLITIAITVLFWMVIAKAVTGAAQPFARVIVSDLLRTSAYLSAMQNADA